MKYRELGKSKIKVSEVGFGAWTIGLDWWGKKIDDDDAIRLLKRAYDLGINFYDTADIYGKGRSEKLIAKAFKDMREEVIYSTKWGYDIYTAEQIGHNELPQKHNPEFLNYALEQSLDRMETDYIDVYSLHNPKMDAIKNDELFTALDDLVRTNKIKSHGVALGPAIGWKDEGLYALEKRNITCVQTVYNILEQEPGSSFINAVSNNNEKVLSGTTLSTGNDVDVSIMVRVPDASGVLTGKVNEKTVFDKNDHRSNRKKEWIIEAMKKIENMKPFAESKGWTITELAIKFILSSKSVGVVLPTVTEIEELEMFAAMSDSDYLNDSELAQFKELYNNNFLISS
jgi:aryl-alcohol dehydrogenase-like predicted oxidoreductase